jgi:hypothetical protein
MNTDSEPRSKPSKPETVTIPAANRLSYDCFNIEVNGDEVVAFADNGRLVLTKKGDCQIVPAGKGQRYAQLVCDRTKIVVQ